MHQQLYGGDNRNADKDILGAHLLPMISTRFAISLRVLFLPYALTSVVIFFLASGRLMARITGLWGFLRNLKILFQIGASSGGATLAKVSTDAVGLRGPGVLGLLVSLGDAPDAAVRDRSASINN